MIARRAIVDKRAPGLDFERTRSPRVGGMIATLSIAEAARDRRLSPHTLRYYERAGLLDAVPRDGGGRRRYTEADLDRVLFLQRMRRTGMPIRVLREYVALVRQGDSSARCRKSAWYTRPGSQAGSFGTRSRSPDGRWSPLPGAARQ